MEGCLFIYQLFWTQACPEEMCTNGTQVPCEEQSLRNPTTREGWPHHRGLRPLLLSNSDVGSLTFHKNKSVKVLWDRTYGFLSLSEKTRKSSHLQMWLHRQHLLLSYLKTLRVGPAGVPIRDLPLSRQALSKRRCSFSEKCVKLRYTIYYLLVIDDVWGVCLCWIYYA